MRATVAEGRPAGLAKSEGDDEFSLSVGEAFARAYDPDKRKERGVWYTPRPLVGFIVRALDEALRVHFGPRFCLFDGGSSAPGVAVLDVATGTGTFLTDLVARTIDRSLSIYGVEIAMPSHAMAHLALGDSRRAHVDVALADALDGPPASLLARMPWLAHDGPLPTEGPLLVVMGNPPYRAISANMARAKASRWADVTPYTFVDGVPLGERKHWLHDDYVKFLRLGEELVERNGAGALGYVMNHGWIDNPTFRGLRRYLLETFDVLYVVDLHGSAMKKERAPDGSKDENVFDIRQGVAILVGVKKRGPRERPLARVFHADLWGHRANKLEVLRHKGLAELPLREVVCEAPGFLFVPQSDEGRQAYAAGIPLNKLFPVSSTGIVTMGDGFIVAKRREELERRVRHFLAESHREVDLTERFGLGKNYGAWVVRNRAGLVFDEDKLRPIAYRPFDTRWIYLDDKLVWRPRRAVMRHMLAGANVGLLVSRSATGQTRWQEAQVTSTVAEFGIMSTRPGNGTPLFPLYLASEGGRATTPNLDPALWNALVAKAGRAAEDPQEVFDYVYAVLHAPSYRRDFLAFLKADFPRIPYPESPAMFDALATLGSTLRRLHLFEAPELELARIGFSGPGDRCVDEVCFEGTPRDGGVGAVRINARQRFEAVPLSAYRFTVGGYRPAEKWLKDRKGARLRDEEVAHWSRLVAVLEATETLMAAIDAAFVAPS